ncbi:hypothetical protein CEXT_100471 [Caerostris extrusa]|uniref:Uncharacterized protein n=1 Tax=Caerostris extrusa TaxID=172846 RepID=A0AAV4NJL0_CAEEX|nr:hypothetical protein CEXT_100471 [Caerostris extrusa]
MWSQKLRVLTCLGKISLVHQTRHSSNTAIELFLIPAVSIALHDPHFQITYAMDENSLRILKEASKRLKKTDEYSNGPPYYGCRIRKGMSNSKLMCLYRGWAQ